MKTVTKNELRLAAHMVAGFSMESGETGIDYLSTTFAVDPDLLRSWASERGYLYEDGEGIGMEVMPTLWADFAEESRVCLALNQALQALVKGSDEDCQILAWVNSCKAELNKAPRSVAELKWVANYLSELRASKRVKNA
jgi:hypothetical protein